MLLPRRQLKPRTFRASAGQTIFVGGLARFDLVQIPAQTMYLTVWASDEVACHYGRTETAGERCALRLCVCTVCDLMSVALVLTSTFLAVSSHADIHIHVQHTIPSLPFFLAQCELSHCIAAWQDLQPIWLDLLPCTATQELYQPL